MTAARDVLTTCVGTPRRLSALLADARRTPDPEDVAELVWLTALWSFAPEDPAGDETVGTVDALAGGLAALDDGTLLDDPEFTGADLLVGGRAAIQAIQDAPSPDPHASASADDDVIDLERARRRLGR